jgi:hypothetical protein
MNNAALQYTPHKRQIESLRTGNRRLLLNELGLRAVLWSELEFLEQEGFRRFPLMPRLHSLFQDSPNCPRHDGSSQLPCEACPWFRFVPAGARHRDVPCHFIPLNEAGETAATLASGDRRRQLEVFRQWLLQTLQRMDAEPDT